MGAWGSGPFENDGALDWVWELDEDSDGSALTRAFQAIDTGDADGEGAIAAAEVVAAALGVPPAGELPDEVTGWLAKNRAVVGDDLRVRALRAAESVRDDSELRALWDESGPEAWLQAMNDLTVRLARTA